MDLDFYCSEVLSKSFLKKYASKKVPWKNALGYIVYKRTYSRLKKNGNTEEWWETVARCINGLQSIGAGYTKEEAEKLYDYVFNFKCCFSGRSLWQLGTPLVEDLKIGDSVLNCWATKSSEIKDFTFILMESMFGGGVGVNIAKEYSQELPRVKRDIKCLLKNTKDADFIVPDSKEGWVKLWEKILQSYLITGESFTYSPVCIRPHGEPLKTFGGIAPGPKPLIDGTEELCKILERRAGKKLRTDDVADIICVGGEMIKSGGIRRTALILGGDVDDQAYVRLKRWDLGEIPNYRSNSNNSILCKKYEHLQNSFWEGYSGNGEPYGLVNLKNARAYGRLGEDKWGDFNLKEPDIIMCNPCIPAWSNILTPNGIRQLKDINVGDKIWSIDGWTIVTNKFSNGVKPVFRYGTTANTFFGTKEHKIVSKGDKIEVDQAESMDVLRGEYLEDFEINPLDVMDGLVFGDGSVHKASNNLVFLYIGSKDHDYLESEIGSYIHENREGLKETAYEITTNISHEELPLTYNRVIPDRYFYGNRAKVCGFLRGLYSANGSVCGGRVTLKASSFKAILQVQTMLSSVGIKSYYTTNRPSNVKFSNGEYLCKESYDLNITIDKEKFYSSIGFIQKYKMEKLEKYVFQHDDTKVGKVSFDINSKTFISEEEVFDITVNNKSHTFWCNGCNISNCGEAMLEDKEPCNLAELVLVNLLSKEEMLEAAKLLYKGQKSICAMNYYHEDTNKVVHKNYKIGMSVTGVCQKVDVFKEWCDYTYKGLREFDKKWSKEKGYNQSIRLTVVQPSGTKSLMFGVTPGAHTGYSKYYIRRVRFDSKDSLLEKIKDAGYHVEPEIRFDGTPNHRLLIASFPCSYPDGTIFAKDFSAIDQLNLMKDLQTSWADQAVSITVYYKKEELPDIKNWLKENYDTNVKSVSFLLHSDHGFKQAPFEEITEEQYNEMMKKCKPFDNFENGYSEDLFNDIECAGGACPIR